MASQLYALNYRILVKNPVTFQVAGIPRPKGSFDSLTGKNGKKMFRPNNKHSKPWEDQVALVAKASWRRPLLDGTVFLSAVFFMPRPKSHFISNDPKKPLKQNAPLFHTITPDEDKLLRNVCDALTGIVYKDDCRVCVGLIQKVYGKNPGVSICVGEAQEPTKCILEDLGAC